MQENEDLTIVSDEMINFKLIPCRKINYSLTKFVRKSHIQKLKIHSCLDQV